MTRRKGTTKKRPTSSKGDGRSAKTKGEKEKSRSKVRKRTGPYRQIPLHQMEIAYRLILDGPAQLRDLAKRLGIASGHVEQDIDVLERRRMPDIIWKYERDYPVALAATICGTGLQQGMSDKRLIALKKEVAKTALSMIRSRDSIFIGGGATGFFLAIELARANLRGMRVQTNALYNAFMLAGRVHRIFLPCGELNVDDRMIQPVVDKPVSYLFPVETQKAFIGVDGL